MRLESDPRTARLLDRLPRPTPAAALELALIVLVAVQAARLVWTAVTPLGPLGDWQAPAALAGPAQAGALGSFDPFFRLAEDGPGVVTGLSLQLFGVREDRATGRGSAIVQLPDGSQGSFAVGEEIMPGVTLAEVGFDSITIDRGGTREQLFLDQSTPAPQATPTGETTATQVPVPVVSATPQAAPGAAPLRFEPRVGENQIDGLTVAPGGDGGAAFRAAGFQPGDVIVAVNGQRVTSPAQAEQALRAGGGTATLTVERGGRNVQISVRF
jgi:general secretion pathway protein C